MSDFFENKILERGHKYFEENRVFSINQLDEYTYTGIVLGNEAYHTKIVINNDYDVISASCTCPHALEGNHCKHEAALYLAIDGIIPEVDEQYFDTKAVLKSLREQFKNIYMIKTRFNNEFDDYLYHMIKLNNEGKLHINNYLKVVDEILSSNYPKDYRNSIVNMMFDGLCDLLNNEKNKELTAEWLKEKIKFQRYLYVIDNILDVIKLLNVEDQIDIIKYLLLNKRKTELLDVYFKIINKNNLDLKKYLEDIQIFNNNENYIYEMIKYLVRNDQLKEARRYHKEHKINIKTKDIKEKIKSLLEYNNEDSYYNYITSQIRYYDSHDISYYYDKLEEFYDDKLDIYLLNFIDKVYLYHTENELSLMFKRNRDVKRLIYILLEKPNMELFDNTKLMIDDFNHESFLLVYIECLIDYIRKINNTYYLNFYISDFFAYLDDMSKNEFAEIIKKEFPNRRKLHEIIDNNLEDGDDFEI